MAQAEPVHIEEAFGGRAGADYFAYDSSFDQIETRQ
jgi:hypothetical protein